MSIRKLRSGRVNIPASQYVGDHGTIFWDEDLGTFKLSDGVTPGGQRVVLNAEDINLAFGNFVADDNNLSTVHPNEDLNLVSNGTGTINLVGQLHVYTTAQGAGATNPIFSVNNDGQVRILVPTDDSLSGAVNIIGNGNGMAVNPQNSGVMLHITGQIANNSRLYNDGQAGYAAYIGRRYNGTSSSPAQVLSGDIISRIGATPYTNTGWPTISTARIDFVSTQNQTASALGSRVEFWTTPTNSNAISRVGYVDSTDGVCAIKFTGNISGTTASFTGDVTAGNVIANTVGTLTGNVNGLILTSSQPNITSVGTLSSLTVDGVGAGTGLVVQGNIRYDSAYGHGIVTQLTNKSTSVTCNGRTGQITTSGSSLAKGTAVTFTVNNSYITSLSDVPIIAIQSGATVNSYAIAVTRVQLGSFNITITNNGTGQLSDTIIINFAVIKVG